jgi:predicted transcriptional regulator
MPVKQKFNFRLSDDAKKLLELMAKKIGIPQTNVLELAIREKAATLNVTLPAAESDPPR